MWAFGAQDEVAPPPGLPELRATKIEKKTLKKIKSGSLFLQSFSLTHRPLMVNLVGLLMHLEKLRLMSCLRLVSLNSALLIW